MIIMRKKKDTCPESIFNAKLLSMISIKYESCSIGAMIKNTLHESKKKTRQACIRNFFIEYNWKD